MPSFHKIPQNVITYQGRIVGKFTAKQFIFLAVGAIIVFIIWISPIPRAVQIVTSVPIALIALVFALASFDGRTTDMWIMSFVNTVYNPTRRTWQKKERVPPYLLPSYHPHHEAETERIKQQAELEKFIEFWQPRTTTADLSEEEKATLARIRKLK